MTARLCIKTIHDRWISATFDTLEAADGMLEQMVLMIDLGNAIRLRRCICDGTPRSTLIINPKSIAYAFVEEGD